MKTKLPLHRLPLFNTGRMEDADVIAVFSGREPNFQRILHDLAAETSHSRAQHHLIIGQRGMGKTMLLARLAAEIRTTDLASRFLPLVFAEEQYTVDRLSRFWLNCLESLADSLERLDQKTFARNVERRIQSLLHNQSSSSKNDQPFANEVYSVFTDFMRAAGYRPVLLVDNLQMVFERIAGEQQHALREILMRPGSPILVGASPSLPQFQKDYAAAFYDHFKSHYLGPLTTDQMRELLLHFAAIADRPDVSRRIRNHPARMETLRQLSGGNPRTAATLFLLYTEDFSTSVFHDLENLLDRVTPLYKARFEELSVQQQVIVSTLAQLWDPATARTLVESTGIPMTTVSAQLDRLEKSGYIERVSLSGQSAKGHQIAERFFNIWFLMRNTTRRKRREVEFLTRIIESFCDEFKSSHLAVQLLGERFMTPRRRHLSRALLQSLQDQNLKADLERHTQIEAELEEIAKSKTAVDQILDRADSHGSLISDFVETRQRLRGLVPAEASIDPDEFADLVLGDIDFFTTGKRDRLARGPAPLSNEDTQSLLRSLRRSRAENKRTYSPAGVEWVSRRLSSGQLSSLDDLEDWRRAFARAEERGALKLMGWAMLDCFPIKTVRDVAGEAMHKHRSLLEPSDQDQPWRWATWGQVLFWFLGERDEAIDACRKAVQLDPKNGGCWSILGHLLSRMHTEPQEAEQALRKAIELTPGHEFMWIDLGDHLARDPNRIEEARDAFEQATKVAPSSSHAWINLGYVHCTYHPLDLKKAGDAFDQALKLDPTDIGTVFCVAQFRRDSLGWGSKAREIFENTTIPSRIRSFPDFEFSKALFFAYDENWGLARDAITRALPSLEDPAYDDQDSAYIYPTAVLLHLGYGSSLLELLEELGEDRRRRPWHAALTAMLAGDRQVLLNIAPEARSVAEVIFDKIERILKILPGSTSRWATPKPKKRSARR